MAKRSTESSSQSTAVSRKATCQLEWPCNVQNTPGIDVLRIGGCAAVWRATRSVWGNADGLQFHGQRHSKVVSVTRTLSQCQRQCESQNMNRSKSASPFNSLRLPILLASIDRACLASPVTDSSAHMRNAHWHISASDQSMKG